jgi:hypothetical protein
MVPIVCSTMSPASTYFARIRVEIFAILLDTITPVRTTGGILESKTSAKSHPLTNAIMKPPKKVDRSCMYLPT